MSEEKKDIISKAPEIDLMVYVKKLWLARKQLIKVAGVSAILGLIIAFSLPPMYKVEVTLAPESGKNSGNELSGMASMLGLSGMNGGMDADALTVSLFPDIVESTPFILELFDVHVKTLHGDVDTTLVSYFEHKKAPWWGVIVELPGKLRNLFSSSSNDKEEMMALDPFQLTREQMSIVTGLREAITAEVDKKSGITTVGVVLQDPLVTAIVADSVVAKLQKYITSYRVSKAQQDCNYLEQLYKERQQEYYVAQQNYANYMDANKNVILQTVLTEGERLQNEMSLAYQVYSQVANQLQVARAKVQEAKPVFAVVEPASVPLHPSGTSKKMILIGFVFLAVIGASAWILFGRDLLVGLKKELSSSNIEIECKQSKKGY